MSCTEAFDIGDKRIQKFKRLWKMVLNEEKLSTTEENNFNKYIIASKGCVMKHLMSQISQAHYETLIESGWKDNEKNSLILNTELGSQELIMIKKIHLKNNQYQYMGIIKPLHEAQILLHIPNIIKHTLESPTYKNRGAVTKIAERETYTFAGMSESAIKEFYPEAYQLRKKFIEKCADETLEQSSTQTSSLSI